MSGFARHRRSKHVFATFTGFEADLLRSLAAQLIELLRDDAALPSAEQDPFEALLDFTGPTTAPEDPVLARLLPSAYRDDEESAGEFRRFTEAGLRSGKAAAAGAVIETLHDAGLPDPLEETGLMIDVELEQADAEVWLRALNDLRLALGTRLGVEEGDEDRWDALPEEDPRTQAYRIYYWLSALQETLVSSLGH